MVVVVAVTELVEVLVALVLVLVTAMNVIVKARVAVVVKDLVGAGGVIDTLVRVLLIGVLINMLNAAMIALDFAVRKIMCFSKTDK